MESLSNIEFMKIQRDSGNVIGGSQLWYSNFFRRLSGCGPTAASNMIWYLGRLHPELDFHIGEGGMLLEYKTLQKEMFRYVTPGFKGVDTAAKFTKGFLQYGLKHGVLFHEHVLEIPQRREERPDWEVVCEFLTAAMMADCPVAFLNLHNGTLCNLDSWHWVTILGIDSLNKLATISDQGRKFDIALERWLIQTTLGGALVYMSI